ncbi:cation-translocating P-type ATPase [Patescibacteria group bacterium]|nr:cation-translocating P-type ATPase [Patescibacteria group bacterium]MCL5091576.1 cation-translocating P-type ATPase [Patescibacteria group bacterium]
MTYLLLAAALLSFVIGEPIDGGLILTIIFLNALFGLYQERKAEASLAALRRMTVTRVRVFRDGQEQEIDSRFLVPGDLVYVEEGSKITADARIVEANNLEINEATLTGESLPVVKHSRDAVFSGTIVVKGRGKVTVTATGMNTKFGQIAGQIAQISDSKTPLQQKLEELTKIIGYLGIGAALMVFTLTLLRGGHGTALMGGQLFPAFLLAISLAVAVVPEGLPAVMTITLAIGVGAMAKKKSIIRKLAAIEALGSVTLIATDKTGTLTTNKMRVKETWIDNHIYGENERPLSDHHRFSLLVLNGVLCSTASLVYVHDHGRWDVLGDPTEGALLYLAQDAGLNLDKVRQEWQLIGEEPFDSVTKKMTVVVKRVSDGRTTIFAKGAPETILADSTHLFKGETEVKMEDKERELIRHQVASWARQGLRVLAFGYKSPPLHDGLTFLGLVAIHDAPRPEVVEAVERAKAAGIKIVMVTGDNENTAEAIGVTAGIIREGDDILTGKQLDNYSDEELLAVLPRVRVFARTTPFQKHRIVSLYQRLGEIVAVTGDGVNDAIALKQADVGVAMGLVGTDVARETADMVITDDNFASIVNAIEEGRNIIKNLKSAIKYLLSCNISEAIAIIAGLLIGLPNLFYPIQLLYINLVTDGLPALVLAFSPRDSQQMQRPPETKLSLLQRFEKQYIILVGIMSAGLVIGSYYLFALIGGRPALGQSAAFTVLTLIQSFILIDLWLSHRPIRIHFRFLFSHLFILAFAIPFIAQFVIVRFSTPARLFRVAPLSISQFMASALIASTVLLGIRVIKRTLKIHQFK